MVAIDVILLPECTGEECGGDNEICTGSRVHHRNPENRAPVTRKHRGAPSLGRWMEQDPAQYFNGANTYLFVDSSSVGNVDAEGMEAEVMEAEVMMLASPIYALGPTEYKNTCSISKTLNAR